MSRIDYSQFPKQKLEKLLQEISDQNEAQRIASELRKRRTEELINLVTSPDKNNNISLEETSLNNSEIPLNFSNSKITSIVPITPITPSIHSSNSDTPIESKNTKGLWFWGVILLAGILLVFYYLANSVRRDFDSQVESLNHQLSETKSELENLRRENDRISFDLNQKERDNNQIRKQLDDTRTALREAQNLAPKLTHSWKEQLELFQGQCFQRATVALKNSGFTDDFVSDERTGSVLGVKNGYRASIRCISGKGVVFFVVAGSDSDEIIKFTNLINSNF